LPSTVGDDQRIRLVCPRCGSNSITSWEQTSTGYLGVRFFLVFGRIEVDYDHVYDEMSGDDGGGYADDLACNACCVLLTASDLIPEGTEPNLDWSPFVGPQPLSADAALDAIAAVLDGRLWRPAEDLESIADTLRKTGRAIREPG
jgi:hypothetical protein